MVSGRTDLGELLLAELATKLENTFTLALNERLAENASAGIDETLLTSHHHAWKLVARAAIGRNSRTVELMNDALSAQVACLEAQESYASELVRKLNRLASEAGDDAHLRELLEAGIEVARAERAGLRARVVVAKVALR